MPSDSSADEACPAIDPQTVADDGPGVRAAGRRRSRSDLIKAAIRAVDGSRAALAAHRDAHLLSNDAGRAGDRAGEAGQAVQERSLDRECRLRLPEAVVSADVALRRVVGRRRQGRRSASSSTRRSSTRASSSARCRPPTSSMTNPAVLEETVKTRGENLIQWLAESGRGPGARRRPAQPKMADLDAFKFGENIANSPGKIVFQNDLMQLIQYAPSTATVHRRPLLIVPPWINKFYILDLKPKNSFIKWCVDQGHTVFVISWVNPGPELAGKDFSDYLLEGPLGGARCDRAGDRRNRGQRHRLLHRRHAAREHARLHGRDQRQAHRRRRRSLRRCSIFPRSATSPSSSTRTQLKLHRQGHEAASATSRATAWPRRSISARERPDLVLLREQLSARPRSAGVRPAVLEFGRDAHAGGDAVVLSAQHVPAATC